MIQVIGVPSRVAPTVAQQIFVIGSGAAGIVGGLVLARKFTEAKDISLKHVLGATIVSTLFTLGAALALADIATRRY